MFVSVLRRPRKTSWPRAEARIGKEKKERVKARIGNEEKARAMARRECTASTVETTRGKETQ